MVDNVSLSNCTSGMFSSIYMFTLKLSFLYYKLFGIAPFTLITTKTLKRNNKILYILSFQCSTLSTIYNVLLFTICPAYGSYVLYFISGLHYLYDSELAHIIEVSLGVASILVSTGIWMYFTYYRTAMVDITNHLVEIDVILTRTSCCYVKKNQLSIFIILLLNTAMCIILLTIELIAYDVYIGRLFIYVFPVFIMSMTLIQYASMLNLIKERFEYLNKTMGNIVKFNRLRSEIAFTSSYEPIVKKIIGLRKVHNELCELCQEIADFYAIPVLFAITLMSGYIIYNGYDMVLPIIMPLTYHISIITLSDCTWLLMEIIPIIVMARTINSTITEMKRISIIIHTILNQDEYDNNIRRQLKDFSLEMVKKKIHFTAYYCFPLDCTVLQSMLSTTITYLVILLQLKARSLTSLDHLH